MDICSHTRVETRNHDASEDLRMYLVLDAITVCHVHDLNFMAQTMLENPADEWGMIDCRCEYLRIPAFFHTQATVGHRHEIHTSS